MYVETYFSIAGMDLMVADAKSIPELFDILRQLVEKEKLEYIGGQYQLHSKHKRT